MIEPADYESFRDEIKAKFEATVDAQGKPLGTLVFKPEEIYHKVAQRRPGPDRPLRRPLLAVDRRRRLSDDPRPGERHRARRLQPRPVRVVHPGGLEQPACKARSPEPACWTSHRRFWTWQATRSRLRCKAGRWSRASVRASSEPGDYTLDDETIVRDRLSGLGYIG